MYFISYRKNFWSNTDYTNQDAIRDVPIDGSSEGTAVSEENFNADINNKRLLLLIHGYHNTREDIVRGYAMIDATMRTKAIAGSGPRAYAHIIGVAWPGGFTKPSYPFAKMRANAIGDAVFARLRKVVATASAVDVMTHSLGARVILKALQNADPESQVLRHLFLTAPAVDDESIQEGEKFFISTAVCRKVYVFHSVNDPVLKFTYPIVDFDEALGYEGPDKPEKVGDNVQLVDSSDAVKAHSDYRKRLELYTFIKKVLNGQATPDQLPTDEGFVPGADQ